MEERESGVESREAEAAAVLAACTDAVVAAELRGIVSLVLRDETTLVLIGETQRDASTFTPEGRVYNRLVAGVLSEQCAALARETVRALTQEYLLEQWLGSLHEYLVAPAVRHAAKSCLHDIATEKTSLTLIDEEVQSQLERIASLALESFRGEQVQLLRKEDATIVRQRTEYLVHRLILARAAQVVATRGRDLELRETIERRVNRMILHTLLHRVHYIGGVFHEANESFAQHELFRKLAKKELVELLFHALHDENQS